MLRHFSEEVQDSYEDQEHRLFGWINPMARTVMAGEELEYVTSTVVCHCNLSPCECLIGMQARIEKLHAYSHCTGRLVTLFCSSSSQSTNTVLCMLSSCLTTLFVQYFQSLEVSSSWEAQDLHFCQNRQQIQASSLYVIPQIPVFHR